MDNQRLIDANRLSAVLQKNFGHTGGAAVLQQLIDIAPTVDPVRHARWVMGYPITCSGCDGAAPEEEDNDIVYRAWLPDWCPHCGARMDEGEGGGARE